MNSLSMILVAASACQLLLNGSRLLGESIAKIASQIANEDGEQQGDFAFFVVLVVIAALALVFVVGPQVTTVYAQAVQSSY